MFCVRDSYDSYYQTSDETVSYDESRTAIADTYFNGYSDFSPKHVDAISEDYNSKVSFEDIADGAFFDSGDGGGDG